MPGNTSVDYLQLFVAPEPKLDVPMAFKFISFWRKVTGVITVLISLMNRNHCFCHIDKLRCPWKFQDWTMKLSYALRPTTIYEYTTLIAFQRHIIIQSCTYIRHCALACLPLSTSHTGLPVRQTQKSKFLSGGTWDQNKLTIRWECTFPDPSCVKSDDN